MLADEIRRIREELDVKKETLQQGRATLSEARSVAVEQKRMPAPAPGQLVRLEHETARLRAAAAQKRVEQEAALNAALEAKGDVAAQIEQNEAAFGRPRHSSTGWSPSARRSKKRGAWRRRRLAARRAAIPSSYPPRDSAGRRSARASPRSGADQLRAGAAVHLPGRLLPALPRRHRHGGRLRHARSWRPRPAWWWPRASRCGRRIRATAWSSTTAAASRPGTGTSRPRSSCSPGQVVGTGQVIGYEGTTGFSTGCHLHFATNDQRHLGEPPLPAPVGV